jgi:hypothetical protein
MAYTLDQFCSTTRAALKDRPLQDALPLIAKGLENLIANPAFVSDTFNDDMPPGHRVLYHDAETDFYVLAHVQQANKTGKPHSHGASWAVYGNAREQTEMTEWRRVNAENADHAELVQVSKYRIRPGQTKFYGPGVIHSTAHPEKAWVIRVTGTDLDTLPRYHFGKDDRILAQA